MSHGLALKWFIATIKEYNTLSLTLIFPFNLKNRISKNQSLKTVFNSIHIYHFSFLKFKLKLFVIIAC